MDLTLGRVRVTPGIEESILRLVTSENWLEKCLLRHMAGDWGEVDDNDRAVNNVAATRGFRVLSRYPLGPETPDQFLYVITDHGHLQTTILLSGEY